MFAVGQNQPGKGPHTPIQSGFFLIGFDNPDWKRNFVFLDPFIEHLGLNFRSLHSDNQHIFCFKLFDSLAQLRDAISRWALLHIKEADKHHAFAGIGR